MARKIYINPDALKILTYPASAIKDLDTVVETNINTVLESKNLVTESVLDVVKQLVNTITGLMDNVITRDDIYVEDGILTFTNLKEINHE